MSKTVAKVEKATLEETKTNKVGFENAPKLFSKWSYDDIKVALSLTLDWRSLLHRLHRCCCNQSSSFRASHCWKISKQKIQKSIVPNRLETCWITSVPRKKYRKKS